MDMSELNRYLDDRPEAKVFRVRGDASTDARLLDLELRTCRCEWRRLVPAGPAGKHSY